MIRRLVLSLALMVLPLSGCATTGQDDPQALPPDVAAVIQAEMDDLTAGGIPPGMIMWITSPEYEFKGASGFANLVDEVPMYAWPS